MSLSGKFYEYSINTKEDIYQIKSEEDVTCAIMALTDIINEKERVEREQLLLLHEVYTYLIEIISDIIANKYISEKRVTGIASSVYEAVEKLNNIIYTDEDFYRRLIEYKKHFNGGI